jgi:hypothetical protein
MKTCFLLLSLLAPVSVSVAAQNGPVADNAAPGFTTHTSSAAEIVKMRDAGVDGSVIRSYIQTLQVPYKATAEDILYLHDHKVPDDLLVEWIKKRGQLVGPATVQAQAQPQATQPGAQSPDLVAAATPAPLPVQVQQPAGQVVYQSPAPTVVYSSPSYVYSDPYWYVPPVSIGFSWGWGYPYYRGGYRGGHYYGHGGYYGGGAYHGGGRYNVVSHNGGANWAGHGGGSWGGHGGGSWGGHSGGGGMHGGGRH